MIEIARRRARRLRVVFRRSALGIAHRGPVPPLMFLALGGQLRARYRYGDLAVSYLFPGDHRGEPDRLDACPPALLDALADALGRLPGDDTPVTLDLNGAVTVRALSSGGGAATELVLARSTYTGTPPGSRPIAATWHARRGSACPS